jgi:hypothetical protein
MVDSSDVNRPKHTAAQEIFRNIKTEYQTLLRDILKDERDLMYLRRRPEIHQKIYDHIKRVIK